jgi:type IV pilus assembly protein PilC
MRDFSYIAKNKDGELIKGQLEAQDEAAAATLLSSKELFPISIFTKDKSSFSLFNGVSLKDKAFFSRQLSTTIGAGLPITQALTIIKDQIVKKKFRETIEQITRDVEGGAQLSASMSRFDDVFSSVEVTLVGAGEASGNLDKSLMRMANSLENDYKINRKIRSALAYPAFIFFMAALIVVLMTVYVMPQMGSLYASFNAKLPPLTQFMLSISTFLQKFGLILLFAIALLTFGLRYNVKKTVAGRRAWDTLKIKTPVINKFLMQVYASRFSRTMAGLIGSGVSIIDSLNITSKALGNVIYRDFLIAAAEKVKGGIPLSKPLKEGDLFPPIVSQMLLVGEQTGEIDNMLTRLADFFDEEVDNTVKSITSIIEPFIIVIMGGIVCVLLLAIMMPIYNIGKIL